MAPKKEYRNAVRSRRLIREAFQDLLNEKEYRKITVTDIVTKADLNRSTFYAHYQDIRGVADDIQNEIFRQNIQLVEEIGYQSILDDPITYLTRVSALLQNNIEVLQKMGHLDQLHQRLDTFRQNIAQGILENDAIPEEVRKSTNFQISIHFFIGGIMNTYQQWSEGKIDCDLDDVSRYIAEMIRQSAKV